MDNIFRIPMDPRQRAEVYNRYLPPISEEDNAILIARLRFLAEDGITLKVMAALIPAAASMVRYEKVEHLYARDLHFILCWLEERKPLLEELHLISVILARWDANHCRTNPYWNPSPTPKEAELNERILTVCERLKSKGQIDESEDLCRSTGLTQIGNPKMTDIGGMRNET